MGGDDAAAQDAARACVRSYRKRMRRYAERAIAKARAKGHIRSLDKLTERVEGERRIVEDMPLIVRETHTETGRPVRELMNDMLNGYIDSLPIDRRRLLARYRIVDAARKVVGVGSVGTECRVVLLEGFDADDPLFLQVKQAQPSVLAPHVDLALSVANQGHRVVIGQRMIQGSPDIFLDWGDVGRRHFYVRQLADMKGSATFDEGEAQKISGFLEYCGLCGWALALAHAESGDPAMIAGYCGNSAVLDDAIARFALAYSGQTERDHAALDKARRAGRIAVAERDCLGGASGGGNVLHKGAVESPANLGRRTCSSLEACCCRRFSQSRPAPAAPRRRSKPTRRPSVSSRRRPTRAPSTSIGPGCWDLPARSMSASSEGPWRTSATIPLSASKDRRDRSRWAAASATIPAMARSRSRTARRASSRSP